MYLTSALLATTLALKSFAFLVPIEVSEAAEHPNPSLAPLLVNTCHTVDLDCPGCPFFGTGATSRVQRHVENKIHLEFGIDAEQTLTINGVPFIHPDETEPYHEPVAPQIRVKDGQRTAPVSLDYALERLPPLSVVTPTEDYAILPLRFTILGLQGLPVEGGAVTIDLLQSPNATGIARISTIPFSETPGGTTCETAAEFSICRIKAILAAQKGNVTSRIHFSTPGCHGRGHGHGPHMGGHFYRLHRFGRMLYQSLRFFIIPALLGVIGGLVVSAIGMLLGQLVSYLWIRFHRNGHRRHGDDQVLEIVIDEEEKDALLVDGELPPPPQYEDVEANIHEVNHDEKH